MANTLGLYDPLFYAQEALIQLEKALGFAARVHRGYEKDPQELGSTINIRRPGTFAAQDMPISAGNTSNITPDSVAINLNKWRGVQFGLTDKELAYTGQRIIDEHVRPSAYAVADDIDLDLVTLIREIPWVAGAAGAVADITDARQVLFDNSTPMNDLHMMIDGAQENAFLKLAVFHEADKSSDGGTTQMRGTLGLKFGLEIFANQNVPTQGGTALTSVTQLEHVSTAAVGDVLISFDDSDATLAGTILRGSTLVFAGHSQRYAVLADSTASSNAFTNVSIAPALKAAVADDEAITLDQAVGKDLNIAFRRSAFALAMAPLPRIGDQLGARIATVVDPITSLALRTRLFYDGFGSKVYVSVDALWGKVVLDSEQAVRSQS